MFLSKGGQWEVSDIVFSNISIQVMKTGCINEQEIRIRTYNRIFYHKKCVIMFKIQLYSKAVNTFIAHENMTSPSKHNPEIKNTSQLMLDFPQA